MNKQVFVNAFILLCLGMASLNARVAEANLLRGGHHNECHLKIIGRVEHGDTAVTVRGDDGLVVNITDFDTEQPLGNGAISDMDGCGTVEIALSQAATGDQLLLVSGDDGSESIKWVAPIPEPTLDLDAVCTNSNSVDTFLYGFDWGNDPVAISWDGNSLGNANNESGFIYLDLEQPNVGSGSYEIQATNGMFTATTRFQIPCSNSSQQDQIEGTVYVEDDGAWLPIADVPVELSIAGTNYMEERLTQPDGSYRFHAHYADLYTVTSCVVIDGVAYADQQADLAAPESGVDLYLEATASAECNTRALPVEPPDLSIGTPQITPVDGNVWNVSVTISNTSNVTITEPFYVDAWTQHGDAYGYVNVPGLGANSSQTVVVGISAPFPINSEQTVKVLVDAAYEIEELDERNNRAKGSITPTNGDVETVAIYLLAFDNPSYSAGNLAPQLPETLKGIQAATLADSSKLAVVLADLDQDGDTHIMTVHNGTVSYINGLPIADGTLSDSLHEYDMSDGQMLGNFLSWARNNFPAPQTSLFVYAHGAPLAPETDITQVLDFAASTRSSTPIPLPSWLHINPDVTDLHPVGLLTPHDLQTALHMATDGGNKPFDLTDLTHCFSLSIEEAVEIAPYTEAITGSPNYAYFDAVLPGAALEAIDASMSADTAADRVIATYDALLPDTGYPRIMAALDSDWLGEVKQDWDRVSAEILTAFDQNATDTRDKLTAAYLSSAKYDTTYCEPDWTLSAPDALSDMHDFATQLEAEFGSASGVGIWADEAAFSLQQAVTSRYVTNGVPIYATVENAPSWTFTGLGVALYTDFGGLPDGNGATQLSWHADFYNDVVSAENPHPYKFITGSQTWSDVFSRYWEGHTITTQGCVQTFKAIRDSGELNIASLVNPTTGSAALNTPLVPSISLHSTGTLGNVIVQFEIMQNGSTVYSDTVGSGRIFIGTHWIKAAEAWTPSATGAYSLTVTVDGENYIDEADEADNVMLFVDTVSAEAPTPTADVTNEQQWITDPTVPLMLNADTRAAAATELEIATYQFNQTSANVNAAQYHGTNNVNTDGGDLSVALGAGLSAGSVEMHVWQIEGGERSPVPTALRVNYIPANTPIAENEMDCFAFSADVGDHLQIRLNVPDSENADLFVWYPQSYSSPNLIGTRVGDDDMLIDAAPLTGDYLLCVRGATAGGTTYTLSIVEDGDVLFAHSTTPENDANAAVPSSRLQFEQPLPQSNLVPTVVTLRTAPTAVSHTLWLVLSALGCLSALTRTWLRHEADSC